MRGMGAYIGARRVGLMLALVALALDWASKAWILAHRADLPIEVVPGVFRFILAWNRGMSFSFLNEGAATPWALGILAVGACAWFIHWLGTRGAWAHQVGLGLLIGGAAGNLLDRVQHGAVVDFLMLHAGRWSSDWYFPVFNAADSFISLGVALLLWDSVRQTYLDSDKKDKNHA